MGSYAVEDSRQAIAEARAAGVFPFCLTVDREEPEYMAHMFGRAGYVMLMQPDQLPSALLKAVRHLIGRRNWAERAGLSVTLRAPVGTTSHS